MNRTETSIAESRQRIRESYVALLRLCASVARADEAVAKSRRILEQYQGLLPAMMDRADAAIADSRTTIIEFHHASQLAMTDKKASHGNARQIAARIADGFREAGFDCELLDPLPLH
jgi:hypothetical protein